MRKLGLCCHLYNRRRYCIACCRRCLRNWVRATISCLPAWQPASTRFGRRGWMATSCVGCSSTIQRNGPNTTRAGLGTSIDSSSCRRRTLPIARDGPRHCSTDLVGAPRPCSNVHRLAIGLSAIEFRCDSALTLQDLRLIGRRIAVDRAAHVHRKRRRRIAAKKPAQPVRISDAIERVRGQQMLDRRSIA